MIGRGRRQAHPAQSPVLIYLSLFLLLLVFFIVLNANSTVRGSRVSAALASVGRSFAPVRPAPDQAAAELARSARAALVAGLLQFGDLARAALAVVKVDAMVERGQMVVALPAEELFEPAGVGVRPDRVGLIDRIADALRDRGHRYEVEFLTAFGADPVEPGDRPSAITRAASVARALIAHGAPPDTVAIGLERGPPGTVRFLFSARQPPPAGGGAEVGDGHR